MFDSQNFFIRRLPSIINYVELDIEDVESQEMSHRMCSYYTIDSFVYSFVQTAMDKFADDNVQFFNDRDGMVRFTDEEKEFFVNIINKNYGNYLRNLYVRLCGHK
jgi:hypothetical protein